MLSGLSFELLYKALIIEIGKEPPRVHNLRELSALAEIKIDDEDLKLMDILTDHITWAGKYPIPRGDRKEWDQLTERMYTALTDLVPDMSIPLIRRNDRLNWDDYSRIWKTGNSRYWDQYHQRNG